MTTKTTKLRFLTISRPFFKWALLIGAITAAIALVVVFRHQWLPWADELLALADSSANENDGGPDDSHDDHAAQAHAGHDEASSLELSPQARKNIGLQTAAIKLQLFVRTVAFPAIVIRRPGRSEVEVTAPLGGRVTRVYPIEGEAVEPGQPLFDLRLTHEELVQAQSEFLRSVEELDVELREIKRIEAIVESGLIAGKRMTERQYEKQKIEAVLNAREQSLLLHGLTPDQVAYIRKQKKLVAAVTVVAPEYPKNANAAEAMEKRDPFTVRKLSVKSGQYVEAGGSLCRLMDYSELYVQGHAFEHDDDELQRATREEWELTASREDNSEQPKMIKGLKSVYVENEVEPESRALNFYVRLHNEVVHSGKTTDGHRFLTWRYKPGQRMQLHVPVERWEKRIVLPVDAVAKEGVEFYVFQQNGDHFDRVPVRVEYQDQFWTVIANDGSVYPGDIVATSAAHQLQMALKNKAGGGVDPHAGHSH